MKTAKTKTRYFRKDYAPARAIAARRKTSRHNSSHLSTDFAITAPSTKTTNRQSGSKSSNASRQITTKVKTAAAGAKKVARKVATTSKTVAKNLTAEFNERIKKPRRTSTSSRRSHTKRKPITWSEITLISIIGTSAIAIAAALIISSALDPVKRSEQELAKLADSYYVEYLYPRTLAGKFDEAETILKDFTVQGLPNIHLRQLLSYDNGKYADSLSTFSNEHYQCDTNKTYVRYYPVAPYGPRDFTVYYGTSCEKVGAAE